jgi:uncharacterized protein
MSAMASIDASVRQIVAEAKAILEAEYGHRLVKVVLFGSHARGEGNPHSDIDLLVVLRGDVRPSAEVARLSGPLAELSLQHDTVVSCVFVAEERYHNDRSPFLLNVRREGIAA